MVGGKMNLNESQNRLIIRRINEVWTGNRPCPICSKSTRWDISGIHQVQQYNEGNHCPGAAIAPLILVSCRNCGNTILFNAISLGIVDPSTGKVREE
jgi:hypothetical protein